MDEALEDLIERFRPPPEIADEPASGGQLRQINRAGLLFDLISRQTEKSGDVVYASNIVATKQTAWEVMADAQRNGVRFSGQEGAT